jgi:uncharacterized repeat protein (TIGR04138 family)
MITFNAKLSEVVARDPRFAYEAYEFVYQALDHTLKMQDRATGAERGDDPRHVSGRELLEGIRCLALQEFGRMARTVFQRWGLRSTEDFGAIIFNLVDAELMSKTDEDNLDDFKAGFDFDAALVEDYDIPLDEAR